MQIALQLEARGYLRLVPDPSDARTTRLAETGKVGVFDEPEVAARSAEFLAEAFAGLSPGEVRTLRRPTRRWLTALAPSTEPSRSPRTTDAHTISRGGS